MHIRFLAAFLILTTGTIHTINASEKIRSVKKEMPMQPQGSLTYDQNLASFIDHTLLKPDATIDEIDALCKEALTFQFASVCVHPFWVRRAVEHLNHSNVGICTVVGFPLGANTTEIKVLETKKAVMEGATEIDMVINIGALKSGNLEFVEEEIRQIVQAAESCIVKVILEIALLTVEEIQQTCECAKRAGAHFVKTSTGFGPAGASVEAVQLMRQTVGSNFGVKAAGGIRDKKTMQQMIDAGADRIGTSSGVSIVAE